jgi:hypothetical protein
MKRLWPFLLVNVAVSATTVLIILLIWNASHPCLATSATYKPTGSAAGVSVTATATLPPLEEDLFKVDNVIGVGDVKNEHVHLVYLGSDPLDLQNWQIKDRHKHSYVFPAFVIYKDCAFDLYTGSGVNSTIELYMGQTQALWQSGETLTLVDPSGNTRLTYKIP